MLVNFDNLSENTRIWVYPSSRKFYPKELDAIETAIKTFVASWSDEDNFKASYQFLHNRFIIFAVDENFPLTNSLIDLQVQFILNLEQQYEISLLDKMNVCFKQGEYIQYKDVIAFKKLLKDKSISDKTIVFDNLVQTKYDLKHFWEVPITESWYSRFLKK